MNRFLHSPQAIEENCNSPIHDHILDESDVLAAPAVILNMDLKVVQLEDLEVRFDW